MSQPPPPGPEPAVTAPDQTVVEDPPWVWWLLTVVLPVAGAGLAILLKLGLVWLAELPGRPGPGWFRLITNLVADAPEPWITLGAAAVGLVAGLLLTAHWHEDSLTVAVSDRQLTLTRKQQSITLARKEVGAVFLADKQLVVLGPDTAERARQPCDHGAAQLAPAFTAHSYPWHDGDPHASAYHRWVPGLPELPPGADALFQARERALSKPDPDDASELRAALAGLGLVVRDEKTHQYWRRHG